MTRRLLPRLGWAMRWHDPRGVSSELIGRTGDLQTLLTLATTARTGHGQTGLVAGEAGVGKSRLIAELRGCLERDGFRVCEGQCFEVDRALPYAPVLDLLRAELAGLSPEQVGSALGPVAPVLAPLLPELAGLLHVAAGAPARSCSGEAATRPRPGPSLCNLERAAAAAPHRRGCALGRRRQPRIPVLPGAAPDRLADALDHDLPD